MIRIVIALLAGLMLTLSLHAQPDNRIDPKSPELATLPEVGRMVGTAPHASRYGQQIARLGDINKDRRIDWCVSAFRTGTTIWPPPVDLLVYMGVAGRLPSVESGQRVGPSEIGSNTTFIAAGDWDGDSHIDIATKITLRDDTTGTSGVTGWTVSRAVIFWGNAEGNYSLEDTTRLENGAPIWLGPGEGFSLDLDGDGVDDLMTVGNSGLRDGKRVPGPYCAIYHGHRGKRWGRDGRGRTPDWTWWNPPPFRRLYSIDQNCDDVPDLVFPMDDENVVTTGQISILYGTHDGGIPDTADVVTLDLAPVNGHNALLSDVTGDHVPELLVGTLDETLRIYAGEPGVRLLEQFGTGNDTADPTHGRWYRRPWAEIPLPHKLDDAFSISGDTPLFALGDAGLNGTNDIWVYCYPFIISYSTGKHGECLDSLFDGIIFPPKNTITSVAVVGDIDGSGVRSIAIGYDEIPPNVSNRFPGGILFVKPTRAVLEDFCVYRTPLHGDGSRCGTISTVLPEQEEVKTLFNLRAVPNPGTGHVRLFWSTPHTGSQRGGEATISVYDIAGQAVTTAAPPATDETLLWDTSSLPAGHYYITLTIAGKSTTLQFLLNN